MIIMLAGPPKVGKSVIAKHLRDQLGWFHLCTDDLVEGLKTIIPFDTANPLFANDQYELADLNGYYAQTETEIISQNYSTSLKEVSKALIGFIDSLLRHRQQNLIIEGVAMLPSFFSADFWGHYPVKYFAFGNSTFAQSLQKPSLQSLIKTGWLNKLNDRALIGFGNFVNYYSQMFKKQCETKNLPYYELISEDFEKQIQEIEKQILSQIDS